jgi:hypothetical protein
MSGFDRREGGGGVLTAPSGVKSGTIYGLQFGIKNFGFAVVRRPLVVR